MIKTLANLKELSEAITPAVECVKGRWRCNWCLNQEPHLFHSYYHEGYQRKITYCRQCIGMGNASTEQMIHFQLLKNVNEEIEVTFPFELTTQQKKGSSYIQELYQNQQSGLLYAVTGAGKTEMVMEVIKAVRRNGGNVALVSPRTDVVKEIALRAKQYLNAELDIYYGGYQEGGNHRIVICTVHQLYRYSQHFDLIIVDEIDAFPMYYDERLHRLLSQASTNQVMVFLSATPPRKLINEMKNNTLHLPSRYHRRPLPVPKYKFLSIHQMHIFLEHHITKINKGEVILIFFSNIEEMKKIYDRLPYHIQQKGTVVYAGDELRHEKVERIRNRDDRFVMTTTILERGFTMEHLSVWVMNAGSFKTDSLIQIAGRVDRKGDKRNGEVIFFHDGVSISMIQAVREIKKMNNRAMIKENKHEMSDMSQ